MHSALENVILTEADTGGACVISLTKVARTGVLAITVVDINGMCGIGLLNGYWCLLQPVIALFDKSPEKKD